MKHWQKYLIQMRQLAQLEQKVRKDMRPRLTELLENWAQQEPEETRAAWRQRAIEAARNEHWRDFNLPTDEPVL